MMFGFTEDDVYHERDAFRATGAKLEATQPHLSSSVVRILNALPLSALRRRCQRMSPCMLIPSLHDMRGRKSVQHSAICFVRQNHNPNLQSILWSR